MNLKLIKETDTPLMARKTLEYELDYSGSRTPSNEETRKTIAAAQKTKEELVVIKHIYPKFGDCRAKAIASVYKTEADLKKFEPKKKEKKSGEAAAAKK